jgi:hypothetical protein
MELSSSWEAASYVANKELPNILRNPKVREPSTGPYPDPDQSSPYHPILSLMNISLNIRSIKKCCFFISMIPEFYVPCKCKWRSILDKMYTVSFELHVKWGLHSINVN